MGKFKVVIIICVLGFTLGCKQHSKQEECIITLEEAYWWPLLKTPNGIIECSQVDGHGSQALAQSLAGLMAKGLNSGKTDELIWISGSAGSYETWYQHLKKRLNIEVRGHFNVWELLEYCQNEININGYILYKEETNGQYRDSMDHSFNIACMYAGINNAIVIEEKLEQKAKAAGLKMLMDVREKSIVNCFSELKEDLDNRFITTMNPKFTNIRDFVVAYNSPVSFGVGNVTEQMMKRTKPVSPVLGWNTGGESTFTKLPSRYGLFNTASNWCHNFVTLSANSVNEDLPKVNILNPSEIQFEKGSHFHSFIISDGDNMQWSIGNFVQNERYWANPNTREIPIGFTSCPVNLSMMAPDTYSEMMKSQQKQTTIIEYGGGYQYPDLFASELGENADQLHREFAKKINVHMKRTGTRVFGFIVMDIDCENALKAYQIYAEEIKDIVGMFAVQYAPYHGGEGEVFWVKNSKGIDIPVVTARYSLWKDLKMIPERAGTPTTLPEKINKDVEANQNAQKKTYDWTSVHAWSIFQNPEDSTEVNVGVTPVKWCAEKLLPTIKIVSPEELLWRLRMEHDPKQTKNAIAEWKKN